MSDRKAWENVAATFSRADPKFSAWTEPQEQAFDLWHEKNLQRMLLFFPTGSGKSKTTLGLMASRGHRELVVIAPPKTHAAWQADAFLLGIKVRTESHQKFRMKATRYSKTVPIIVDEFHQLGGHTAAGWTKLNRIAAHLQAELILASATPNYNDAERVFCITAICRTDASNRNYRNWLYDNCLTEENYFSSLPDVVGFKEFDSALEYLVAEPYTAYIEDDATWTSETLTLWGPDLEVFEKYNLYRRGERLVASDMEKRHKRVDLQYLDATGLVRNDHVTALRQFIEKFPERKKWLIFCNHRTVAEALKLCIPYDSWLITGQTSAQVAERNKQAFIEAKVGMLIGTTALATGVDGIDKVCQSMIIFDDIVGDHALRRQLIGRILPRGGDDGIERIVATVTMK